MFGPSIFKPVERSRVQLSLIPQCSACGLKNDCNSPKMPVDGKGRKKILILGEAAGQTEDREGKPFVGQSGGLLWETLAKFGVERNDCWIYNSVICRPHTKNGSNRTPTDKEIGYCRPNVIKTIQELKPEVIIPLGGSAVKSLLGWIWKEDVGAIRRWDGWQIPSQKLNAWITPTWHPAALLHEDNQGDKDNAVKKLFFERHLEAASRLDGRPWKIVPDYKSKVEIILDDREAAEQITGFIERGKTTAFDLETNRLKPDHEDAEIFSCSMSDGKKTISFPVFGKANEALFQFAKSDVPKTGHNIKFEHRWFLRFGVTVKNWVWDSIVAAHVLNNSPGITGLKFQSFVLLGQDSYEGGVKPYLKAKGSNTANTIYQSHLRAMLLYGGLDSLLEYKVAQIQSRKLRIVLG